MGYHSNDTAKCGSTAVCTVCGLNFEKKHDYVYHDYQAATCTEIGWEAYETCKNCTYTTYKEILALDHDLVSHDAQAATCTEIGWEAYVACSRCEYTTYKETPPLNRRYWNEIVEPTCEKKGYTLYVCDRCGDSFTENVTEKLPHWWGEWTPDGNGKQSAVCTREGCGAVKTMSCQMFDFLTAGEGLRFCPVSGAVIDGEQMERIENAKAVALTGALPRGEVIVRMNGDYLSLAFEYAGACTMPTGQVRFTLPAALPEGTKLMLVAQDGTETELPFAENDGEISIIVDFTGVEVPVMLVRLATEA